MKCLLSAWACAVPVVAAAQYQAFGHTQRLQLLLPLPVYSSLADTVLVTPLIYQPGQVVVVKGVVNERWWVLSEFVEHREVNRYFLRTALAGTITHPPEPITKRRRRQLGQKK